MTSNKKIMLEKIAGSHSEMVELQAQYVAGLITKPEYLLALLEVNLNMTNLTTALNLAIHRDLAGLLNTPVVADTLYREIYGSKQG